LIPKVIEYGKRGCYPHFVDKDISRDFVYIDDCIEALILAAVKVDSVKGWVINIASGVQTNMEEVAKISNKIFNCTGHLSFGSMEKRQWDLSAWYGNPRIAEEKLGWKAKTTLEEGMRRMICEQE